MDKSLNQTEINKISGLNSKVITYPMLQYYDNIYDIFGDADNFILMYQTSDDYGHWCCVFLRDDGSIEFFDSYGYEPDEKIGYMEDYYKEIGDDLYPCLTYLFLKTNENIHYNPYKFQKYGKGISTCGRWVGERLKFKDFTIDEFKKYIDSFHDKNYDKLVVDLTNNYI